MDWTTMSIQSLSKLLNDFTYAYLQEYEALDEAWGWLVICYVAINLKHWGYKQFVWKTKGKN
jgi:hypothetical protein